jgi:hypothetical protein
MKQREVVPWYREPGYQGPLTEAQKRELDALRSQPKHPAARYEDLPEEVQAHIARLEVESYDRKQDLAAAPALACSAVGVALVCLHYFGAPTLSTFWTWTIGLGLVIVPWAVYRREWNKNAEEFMPNYIGEGRDSPANEALLREWEVNYVSRQNISARNADIQ